ncbi:DUF4352 domain-containing protein [Catenuloplanes japonicus]|uniref:DUF4352 domain-containing protein n=1 Tax=Catenuloplanes japonicus TaxID=33876 RepID=UPI00052430B9|nr:DUF4352 domain-containing protein [Catenuloplanes japonicus]
MRKTTTALLITAALVALGCGSGTSITGGAAAPAPTPSASPKSVEVGQPLSVSSDTLGATWTLSKPEIKTADDFDSKPEQGRYLLVHLKTEVTKGEAYVCSCDLSVVDAGGKVYEVGYGSFDGKPDYTTASLKAGQNTDGWVVFDVSKEAAESGKIQLRVTSLFENSAYGYWQL